jgi:chromosome segregation ATPase
MGSELSNDRELYTHLVVLSNEVIHIKELLGRITTRESEIRNIFDELTAAKEGFVDRLSRLESIVKQAAEASVAEAERAQGVKEQLEREKEKIEFQLREKEETLRTGDVAIKELEAKLESSSKDLERQTLEKAKLLEIRDALLANLSATSGALNLFADNLKSLEGQEIILRDEAEKDQGEGVANELSQMKDLEERTRAEMEQLRRDIRDKDIMLEAKETEIKTVKQTLAAKTDELAGLLKRRAVKRRPEGLVSYFVELGKKH